MKLFNLLFASSLMTGTAFADTCEYGIGNDKILTVENWSYVDQDFGAKLMLSIKNNSDDSYRLINATLEMKDVLGKKILYAEMPPDVPSPAGDVVDVSLSLIISGQRLETVSASDVVSAVCMTSAVTSDGRKLTFTGE